MRQRLARRDPRTIAREMVGLMDSLFPHLLPGVVVHLLRNSAYTSDTWDYVDEGAIAASKVSHAMLFETSVVIAESMLFSGADYEWSRVLQVAQTRQSKFFDARPVSKLSDPEKAVVEKVACNLARMLGEIRERSSQELVREARIPGCGWVSPGSVDFAVGDTLIEVKCSASRFQSPDLRQVLIYWLLSYVYALEHEGTFWRRGVLLNPRINLVLKFDLEELAAIASGGRSNLELAQALCVAVEYESQL